MRVRILAAVAVVCLAAGCSSSSSKKPVAAATSASTAAATTVASSPSATTDVNIGIMCSNLDAQIKDLADLLSKLDTGQSVPAFGIGIPIVGASDAAKKLILDHPNAGIDSDLTAFAGALDGLDAVVIAAKPDPSAIATNIGNVETTWLSLSRHCGSMGDYAFSNRLG